MEIGGLRVGEKPVDGHLPRRGHAHQVDRFTERAFKHRLPEEPDHPLRLADRREPGLRRLRVGGISAAKSGQPQHAQPEGNFLAEREVPHAEEQGGQMERRRQQARRRAGGPFAVGTDKPERAVVPQGVGQPRLPAEIEKVRTTAHGHVLAGIDESAGNRILERRGPPAGPPPRLEHGHPQA